MAVRHKPGVDNQVCDVLSCVYETGPDDNTATGWEIPVDPGWETAKGLVNNVCHLVNDEPTSQLLEYFVSNPFFSGILFHLLFDTGSSDSSALADRIRLMKQRAYHAEGYLVEEGKLWLLRRHHSKLLCKVECIPVSETKELLLAVHSAGGHFGRNMMVLALQQ